MIKKYNLIIILFVFIFANITFGQTERSNLSQNGEYLVWTLIAPGIWKTTIGEPEKIDLLKAAGIEPKNSSLEKMGKIEFPLAKGDISAEIVDEKTYLRFPLQKDEEIFGFGLNFKSVHQRGKIMQLHVDHFGGTDNGRTHAPVPFYVSERGYGVFVNSSRYINVWTGTGVRKESPNAPLPQDRNTDPSWNPQPYSDAVEMLIPAKGVEIYVFGGPTSIDVVKRYNLFCGGGCIPPRWGLGFTQRVPTLFTEEQIRKEIDDFNKHDFPLDFIGLEPGWQSKAYPCTFKWDETRFPNYKIFIKELLDKGIKLNLWTNLFISPESPIYKQILPYTGSHTVWCGLVPDITLPEVQRIISEQFDKEHISLGISGYKIDECDGYDFWLWPDVAVFPSGITGEQMRQTFAVISQKMINDIYRKKNKRTYGLVRGSNGGASSFPFVLYNDYYIHEDFITALINSSFSGILWTPEVRESKTAEEWLRRMQTVCFSPMAMINAWASGTKPWSFPEVEKNIRDIAKLRIQLIPYFYTAFAIYHFEGVPPFRAMNLEENFIVKTKMEYKNDNLNENPYGKAIMSEIKDQYMAGEYLLIAPMFAGQNSRNVILPKGKWYDFYTGDYAGDGEVIKITPGLDKIPVYVKDGGIIPMLEPGLRAPVSGKKFNLTIRYYGSKTGSYYLYDDDGETYNYEKGEYSWRELKVEKGNNRKLSGNISPAEKGKPDNIGKVLWIFMTDK